MRAAVLAAAVVVARGAGARAQGTDGGARARLAQALAAVEQARFREAIDAFGAVLASASATRAELLEAHRYLAMLRAAQRTDEATAAARAHAALAVALDPGAQPPAEAPADVVALFARARAERRGERLRVALALPRALAPGAPLAVRASTAGLPPAFDARLAVRCQADRAEAGALSVAAPSPQGGVDLAIAALRAGTTLACTARLTAAAGALLDEAAASARVPASPPGAASSRAAARFNPTPLVVALVVGTVVAAAAVAVPLGVYFANQRSEYAVWVVQNPLPSSP